MLPVILLIFFYVAGLASSYMLLKVMKKGKKLDRMDWIVLVAYPITVYYGWTRYATGSHIDP